MNKMRVIGIFIIGVILGLSMAVVISHIFANSNMANSNMANNNVCITSDCKIDYIYGIYKGENEDYETKINN